MKKNEKSITAVNVNSTEIIKVSPGSEDVTSIKEYQRKIELANEIRGLNTTLQFHKGQMLICIVEIGQRLVEAKEIVGHGNFGTWCQTELAYKQRTANNYMKIYEEYGKSGLLQNSQAVANLNYTKALELLALDDDEKLDILQKNGEKEITTRELKAQVAAMKEEKELTEKAKKALELEKTKLEKQKELAEASAKKRLEEVTALQIEMSRQKKTLEESAQKEQKKAVDSIEKKLEIAKLEQEKSLKDLEIIKKKGFELENAFKKAAEMQAEEAARKKWSEKVSDLKDQVKDANSKIEQARKEGDTLAREILQKEKSDIEKQLLQAREEASKAKAKTELAEKELKNVAGATAVMKIGILHKGLQDQMQQMEAGYRELMKINPEEADKFKTVIKNEFDLFTTRISLTVVS